MTRKIHWHGILLLGVPLAFLLIMLLFYPFHERFMFDQDEGINAIKSLLIARGYSMYTEIWSDQPPFLQYLLAVWLRIFGFDIQTARILILFLSAALLGAAYKFLNQTWGTGHALAGAVLIFLLPYYNTLSVSVMIGLPAIAFAMCALLALLMWHHSNHDLWLVLSAIALGISVLTKLFTGFLAPIFLIGILIDQKARVRKTTSRHTPIRPALIWSLVFASVVIVLGLIFVGYSNINQLLEIHLAARYSDTFVSGTYTILWFLQESSPILFLALIGSIFIVLERNWLSLYLVAWAAAAFLLLSLQVPVWYHHQLLISIPCAMLAGIAVGQAVYWIASIYRSRDFFTLRSLLSIVAIVGLAFALITRIPNTIYDFSQPDDLLDRERIFLTRMANHAAETQWVVTDIPMYAFWIGASVPPPVAVISVKRMDAGDLTEDDIINVVEEYKPEQVLIGRFEFPKLSQLLEHEYRLLYSRGKRALYLRKNK
jgi:4-amino-4-deoxy-L-arabinose transferase-like glycosyltransferase